MKLLRYSVLVFTFLSPPVVTADELMVNGATDSLIKLLVDAEAVEHRKARKIHHLQDMPGMVLVFFTVEGFTGGNNYTFYLAVFEPSWKPEQSKEGKPLHSVSITPKYRLVGYSSVGGKGWRSVDFEKITVEKKQITLQTKEYASNDPMCCPSKTGTARYRIENDALIELKPNTSFHPTSVPLARAPGG